jgi:hypothetical protein
MGKILRAIVGRPWRAVRMVWGDRHEFGGVFFVCAPMWLWRVVTGVDRWLIDLRGRMEAHERRRELRRMVKGAAESARPLIKGEARVEGREWMDVGMRAPRGTQWMRVTADASIPESHWYVVERSKIPTAGFRGLEEGEFKKLRRGDE